MKLKPSLTRPRVIVSVVIVLAVVAGILLSVMWPDSQESGPAGGAGTVATPSASPKPIPVVKNQWKPGMPIKGIHIYWPDNHADDNEVVKAKATRVLDYVVGTQANSVAISFPLYVESLRGNTVKPGEKTPSVERVQLVVQAAKQRKLRVMLRPLIDEDNIRADGWRGVLQPTNRDQWFSNYNKALDPYLRMAAAQKIETFAVGAELNSLESDSNWKRVIDTARTLYKGELAYSANWDYFGEGRKTVPADSIGMDAYPTIELPDNATLAQVTQGWDDWFKLAGKHADLKKTVIHEVGVPAQPGVYKKSYSWADPKAPLRTDVQATWLEAMCASLKAHNMPGFYVWKLDFHANPEGADPKNDPKDSFIKRPVEAKMQECFAG